MKIVTAARLAFGLCIVAHPAIVGDGRKDKHANYIQNRGVQQSGQLQEGTKSIMPKSVTSLLQARIAAHTRLGF